MTATGAGAPPPSLGHSMVSGALWMVGLRMFHRLIGVISLTILARLLVPADFGLVALAMTVLAFFELFGEVQLDVALIRNRDAGRRHYDSAWTMEIARGAVLATLLAIVAAPAAQFFAEPRVEHVLYAVAAIQLIRGFENIGIVDLRKNLRFGREFAYQFASRLAGAAAAIAAAFVWREYWALVAGIGLQTVCRVALSYRLSDYRPRLSLARFRELFDFSKWILVQNLFFGLREQAPTFVIGRLLNFEVLGLFSLAREVSGFVTTELRAPIRRALFPGFARMSAETGELKAGFLDAFAVIFLMSLPLSVGLYAVAPQLVDVLLGARWKAAVPLLEILAIYGIVQSFGTNSYLVYNRLGRPRLSSILNGLFLVYFLPALVWGTARYGATGAAWAIVCAGTLHVLIDVTVARRVLQVGLREFAGYVWRPIVAATCMALALDATKAHLPDSAGAAASLGMLVLLVALGALVYVGTVLLAWRLSGAGPGAERHTLRAVEDRMRPLRWQLGASS